jgi:peptidoglycan-associated lipoprotein
MSRLTTFALLCSAVLVTGCKKKAPAAAEPVTSGPELRLQVTSIDPSAIALNVSVPATVFGSAFEEGARVTFSGPSSVAGVNVRVSSPNTLSVTVPALALGAWDVVVTNADGTSATLRGGLSVKQMDASCRNVTVNFALDRSSLDAAAKSTLDANMSCLQQTTGPIRVQGHCDERGTTDYNLALGFRRADTVRSYLVSGGVASSRVATTSFGEEKPLDAGHNEAAWAKNRRVEILAGE